jgi:hypothetical protein
MDLRLWKTTLLTGNAFLLILCGKKKHFINANNKEDAK